MVAKRTAASPGGIVVEPVLELVDVVDELHHRGDRGVELEAGLDVAGDLVDRPVGLGAGAPGVPVGAVGRRAGLGALVDLAAEAPDAGEEPEDALDALVVPVPALDRGAHEADVGAGGVGAQRSTYSAGLTVLPFDLDIFAPSRVIIPWVKRFMNGSCASSRPMSVSALQKKRAYIRCRIACSTPPMYWSTGIQ